MGRRCRLSGACEKPARTPGRRTTSTSALRRRASGSQPNGLQTAPKERPLRVQSTVAQGARAKAPKAAVRAVRVAREEARATRAKVLGAAGDERLLCFSSLSLWPILGALIKSNWYVQHLQPHVQIKHHATWKSKKK